ncbi:MAG: SpoIIE family protein phosphatase [Sphingobacteriaceae bacterium]
MSAQTREDINVVRKRVDQNKNQEDTLHLKDLLRLSNYYIKNDLQASLKYFTESEKLAKKLKRIDYQIDAMNGIADAFWYIAKYDKAFDYYYKAYHLADSINDRSETALSLYNLGWLSCIDQKNYKDIAYLYRSLGLYKDLKDDGGFLDVYNAIGLSYSHKYRDQGQKIDFDSAVYYLKGGIDLARKSKQYRKITVYYSNLGDLFYFIKDYSTAKFYHESSRDQYRLNRDTVSIVSVDYRIALCDFALYKKPESLKIIVDSYKIFKRSGQRDQELEALENIAYAYYELKEYKTAVDYYDQFSKLKADIDKTTYANNLKGMETSSNLEKAKAKMLQLQQSNEIEELKNKRKTTYISFLGGVALIIIVIVYLLFRQNKLKQSSNLQLQDQNKIISEKKHEIEQSIEYAKGIQTSFLPDRKHLNDLLPNNFIFYQPKDIVSGDFYWFETSENRKQVLIACADSTGHGVPGALMSMVGINMLQQFCGNEKLHPPAIILKNLNNEVKNALKQNTEQNKQNDGMDIALINLNLDTNKLLYSSANRPLYLIKGNELIELKLTKCAIGGFTKYNQEFEETEIQLDKGDMIVMTTDGYADQFGGEEGKKLMTKKLKAILLENKQRSCDDQYQKIESTFNDWKGEFDQVDDVCIIGIRL